MQIRYALYADREELEQTFGTDAGPSDSFEARYNISPGNPATAVFCPHPGQSKIKTIAWLNNHELGGDMHGCVHVENIHGDSKLKKAFLRQRCIVPANGFFLWQKMYKIQVPFYIRSIEEDMIGFAAVYTENGFSLIRIPANTLIQPIQEYMPAILDPKKYNRWLDPVYFELDQLVDLLKPYSTEKMSVYRVSNKIDNPNENSRKLIQPIDA